MDEAASPPPDAARIPATVADAMRWGLVQCGRDASLREVAALMAEERVHCVVVIDEARSEQALLGLISDLDLVAASTVRPLDEQHAAGTAARPVVTIAPEDSLASAARRMTTHGASHLVVADKRTKRPVGVLSTLDVASALSGRRRIRLSADLL